MIELIYITLAVMILLFLLNVYLLFMRKKSDNSQEMINRWKISLLLFTISLIAFFLYYGTVFNTLQQTTTYTFADGSSPITVTNTNYLDGLTFFPLMEGMLVMNFGFLVAQVFIEFQVFSAGRGRMKKRVRQQQVNQGF